MNKEEIGIYLHLRKNYLAAESRFLDFVHEYHFSKYPGTTIDELEFVEGIDGVRVFFNSPTGIRSVVTYHSIAYTFEDIAGYGHGEHQTDHGSKS